MIAPNVSLERLKEKAKCNGCTKKSDCLRLTVNPKIIMLVSEGIVCPDRSVKK